MDSLEKLYNTLQEELENELHGTITFDGYIIKWEYDCFGVDLEYDVEEHLEIIHSEDYELIEEVVFKTEHSMSVLEIDDTIATFYID